MSHLASGSRASDSTHAYCNRSTDGVEQGMTSEHAAPRSTGGIEQDVTPGHTGPGNDADRENRFRILQPTAADLEALRATMPAPRSTPWKNYRGIYVLPAVQLCARLVAKPRPTAKLKLKPKAACKMLVRSVLLSRSLQVALGEAPTGILGI